jgi:hypothetical protein
MVSEPAHPKLKLDFHRVEQKEKFHHSDFVFDPHSHCIVKLLNGKMPKRH